MLYCNVHVKVSFSKHTISVQKDSGVVEGDYNTTKLIFEFEEDVSGQKIVLQMSNPKGELIFSKELSGNELVLAGEDSSGNICSVFNMEGLHPFELVLYGDNSKLTSATGWLPINKRHVNLGSGSSAEYYLPLFDELNSKLNNINFDVTKEDGFITISYTNINGITCTMKIPDCGGGSSGSGLTEEQLEAFGKVISAMHTHGEENSDLLTLNRFGTDSEGQSPTFLGEKLAFSKNVPVPYSESDVDKAISSPTELESPHLFMGADSLNYFYLKYIKPLAESGGGSVQTSEVTLTSNDLCIVDYTSIVLLMCTNSEMLPTDKEIISVEFQKPNDPVWYNVEGMIHETPDEPCLAFCKKTTMNPVYELVSFGVLVPLGPNSTLLDAIKSGDVSAKIVYKI